MIYHEDTISAIATPPGRGGIGIIRISGPKAKFIGEEITQKIIVEGKIMFSRFFSKEDEVLDEGLVLFFKGPRGLFSRAELLHGGGCG